MTHHDELYARLRSAVVASWDERRSGVIDRGKHDLEQDYHQWILWEPKQLSVAFTIARGGYHDWYLLSCNNTQCGAFVFIRDDRLVGMVTAALDLSDG